MADLTPPAVSPITPAYSAPPPSGGDPERVGETVTEPRAGVPRAGRRPTPCLLWASGEPLTGVPPLALAGIFFSER